MAASIPKVAIEQYEVGGEVITATVAVWVSMLIVDGCSTFWLESWKGRSEMMWMSRIGKGEVPWSPG